MRQLSILCLFMFLLACATTTTKIGEAKLVLTSGKRPDWVKSDKDYFIKDGVMHFRAVVTNRKDLAYAKREAKAESVKNIAEQINIRVRTEFKQASEGSNISQGTLSNFASDAIAWIAENLNIQGITPTNSYWEKYEKLTQTGVSYYYDLYILAQIPEADYFQARELAIKNLMARYEAEKNVPAREAADAVYQKLYQK